LPRAVFTRYAPRFIFPISAAMLSGAWDKTRFAMDARILRPLLWFGLLEQRRSGKIPNSKFGDRLFYRKAQLFDRLLTFAVQVELSESVRH
jgi:hypothetical protein